MCLFAIGIEDPLDVTVQRLHDPIRASIGSPPRLHSMRVSIAVCHSGKSDSFLGNFIM